MLSWLLVIFDTLCGTVLFEMEILLIVLGAVLKLRLHLLFKPLFCQKNCYVSTLVFFEFLFYYSLF